MRNLRLGRRGVAGFFEEIPAAVAAIVSLLLFFTAVLTNLNAFYSRQENTTFADQAETFLEGLLSYRNLTYDQQTGIFTSWAVMSITVANLTYDFHPPFNYLVSIQDISLYHRHYDRTLYTALPPTSVNGLHQGMVNESTTVQIYHPVFPFGSEYHSATLTVVIWE